ncbi:MAG: hypothetical protein HWQ38_32310 [Nostoc sp. NMS7]|nr:hypothetical protein [Nostoc sp. NMS7]
MSKNTTQIDNLTPISPNCVAPAYRKVIAKILGCRRFGDTTSLIEE